MSFSVATDVHCDGDCGGNWIRGVVDVDVKKSEAKAIAKRAGWKFVHGIKAYCPKCVEKGLHYEKQS